MMAATAEPSSEPPAVETCWKLPNKPRRFGGAEAADHDAAERPRQEADAIGREGGEQRCGRIAAREELCGDQPGEISIDAEIVPFEQVADCCGQDRLVGLVRHIRAWRGQNRSFRHWITPPCFAAIFHMTIRAKS